MPILSPCAPAANPITGELDAEHLRALRAAHVRGFTPDTMNLEIRAGDGGPFARDRRGARPHVNEARHAGAAKPQLDLGFAL